MQQHQRCHEQHDTLRRGTRRGQVALVEGDEDEGRQRRRADLRQRQPALDADQQQRRVEDHQERQQHHAARIAHGDDAGIDRVGAGNARGSMRRQADRRHHVGHHAEIEHEQMGGDQRHIYVMLRPEGDDDRHQQRRQHDVVGGRGQPGAEHQAGTGHQHQHPQHVATRHQVDQLGEREADPSQRHHAHDDAGQRSAQRDGDHVQRAVDEAAIQIAPTAAPRRRQHGTFALARQPRPPRLLRDDDDRQQQQGRKHRRRRAAPLDRQIPHHETDRQPEIQPRAPGRPGRRQHAQRGFDALARHGIVARRRQHEQVGRQQPERHQALHRPAGLHHRAQAPQQHRHQHRADQHPRHAGADVTHRLQPRPWPSRHAAHARLDRFEMDDVEQADIRHDGCDHRVTQHAGVGSADEIGDQESRCAHHRRHHLRIHRGHHFDRRRLFGRIADAPDQRDGDRPGGHHVGHR